MKIGLTLETLKNLSAGAPSEGGRNTTITTGTTFAPQVVRGPRAPRVLAPGTPDAG